MSTSRNLELQPDQHIHFVGIGGVGMSAIASVLLSRGFSVSGSDLAENDITRRLARAGARIYKGHSAEQVDGADLVVTSTAIRPSNPEWKRAKETGKPIWRRARSLAAVMKTGLGLAISGTHGKTTTTSMMAVALVEAGLDPTALIGGDIGSFAGNARCGAGEWIVVEADESDGSMLDMEPDRIVITNIEADHLDHYRDLDHVIETFGLFLDRLRPGGRAVVCYDCPNVRRAIEGRSGLGGRDGAIKTYSISDPAADLHARSIRSLPKSGGIRFTPVYHGQALEPVRLRIPGRHNVANALAVILTALDLGCDYDAVRRGLEDFGGVKRRFEHKGTARGITVVDDYAHHPTEVRVTLEAARSRLGRKGSGRLVAIFQPHRYSRTAQLAPEFAKALCGADVVVLTDVYSAGESPIDGVSGRTIFENLDRCGRRTRPEAHYVASKDAIVDFLLPVLKEGDLVLTLGAGDIWEVGEELVRRLGGAEARSTASRIAALTPTIKGGAAIGVRA